MSLQPSWFNRGICGCGGVLHVF